MPVTEDFRTLYCDPGEDFGWCTGVGLTLLSGGTEKMWYMTDEVWRDLNGEEAITNSIDYIRDEENAELLKLPIKRVVCEDWRLYPDKLQSLAWDRCRTARVIGAVQFMCRQMSIPFILQPAAIKAQAKAAGAEELYWRPLRENRHQNDAVQHFVFYTQTELLGLKTTSLDNLPGKAEADVDG